jgi:yeast amino acid transporter
MAETSPEKGISPAYDTEFSDDVPPGTDESALLAKSRYGDTKRALKSRHVQLIALGGCIGTGLFVGSGAILSNSGPASLLLAYIIMSFVIWSVMNVLGEMTTYVPVAGASPPMYIERFADKSLAFAAGWNYWYAYAFLVPSEITAAAIVVQYWTFAVPTAAWIAIILVTIIILNAFTVRLYGETEFWFASIKIITICGLIIVGIVIFFGGAPTHDRLGFRYWKNGLAFGEYEVGGASGRFCGFWNAIVRSGFSFILSPELITIASGETEAPRRNVPKATRRFIYRLLFFYIMGSLIIGIIVSSQDPRLLSAVSNGTSTAAASPFVIGIQNAGIPILNHIINAAILTSAWSAANSFLYAGSRTLYSLAVEGQAPVIFRYCNRWGVPYWSVLTTAAVSLLAFLNVSSGSASAFTWLTNLSTISGFMAWVCVLITYLRFRKAMKFNGIWETRPFKTPLQPYASYFTIFFVSIVCITNGFNVFVGGNFSGSDFVAAYITIPIFFLLYFGHKVYTKNWKWLRPVEQVDVISGVAEADAMERMHPPRQPRNWLERVWFWIA